jgi:hypothetical protein
MTEGTLAAQILQDIKDDPEIVDQAQETETPEAEQTPVAEKEETPAPEGTDVVAEETETPPAAESKPPTVEDQLKGLTEIVTNLRQELAALKPQAPEPAAQPAPRSIDPTVSGDLLDGVYDESSLQMAEKDCEALVEFAETHRDGAYDYEVRDSKGNVTKKDFTPEQVTNIKLRAESALRAIPKRREYLTVRAQCDARAVEIYPELAKKESPWRKDAAQLLASVPQLANSPDFMIWIGHALRGRAEFLKEQAGKKNGKTSEAVSKIKAAPQEVAPAVVSTRGTIEKSAAHKIESSRKRLQTEGSEEAAEELLAAMGI